MTREERVAQIRSLVASGYKHREIGALLGLSVSGVRSLLNDPTGEKARARRERYRGTCEVCGASTDGSSGREKAPTICFGCEHERLHDERYWTRETVLASVAAMNDVCVETLGRPIRATDWLCRYDSQVTRFSEARLVEADRLWAEIERSVRPVNLELVRREVVGGLAEAKRLLGIDDSAGRSGGGLTHRRRVAA